MPHETNGHDELNGWRTEAMYTFGQVAHLAQVSASTVRNWLFGYTVKDRGQSVRVVPALFEPDSGGDAMVSFLHMIEIVVAAGFRNTGRGVSFRTVREAYDNARTRFGLEYPFADLKLEALLGGHVVHFLQEGKDDSELGYPSLDRPEQRTLPGLVQETLSQLEYDRDLAARWFPVGKTVPIVVDPRLSTGLPVIQGRGVTVQAISKRFKAGLRIDFIAQDFDMDRDLVETALQYSERVAA